MLPRAAGRVQAGLAPPGLVSGRPDRLYTTGSTRLRVGLSRKSTSGNSEKKPRRSGAKGSPADCEGIGAPSLPRCRGRSQGSPPTR